MKRMAAWVKHQILAKAKCELTDDASKLIEDILIGFPILPKLSLVVAMVPRHYSSIIIHFEIFHVSL